MKKIIISLLYVFMANSAFAEFMCDDATHYSAEYTPISYTCATGEFLPANTLGCVTCPNGFTCPGGTFEFNPNKFQGLNIGNSITGAPMNNVCANNFSTEWISIYTPNQYTCSPGYYVPANHDGCVICPADSYCPGGTYTFNKTETQGINTCANGLHTPAGMWESDQCGRILHIGENVIYMRSTRKTIPSFNIKVGNDIFYGNMTTADVPMSATATQKLKVILGDTIYSVYDDTVNVGE